MIVGITGGIGSGKSYICNRLRHRGYPVYVCDDEAKRLMKDDEVIRKQLIALIGPDAYNGRLLNRKKIADYLFADKSNGQNINKIVHPAVRTDMKKWAALQTSDLCFVESAILIEAGFDKDTDCAVMIYADQPTRLSRAMARDGVSETDVRSRMNQQIPSDVLRQRVAYVLDNSDSADTENEINKMIRFLLNK